MHTRCTKPLIRYRRTRPHQLNTTAPPWHRSSKKLTILGANTSKKRHQRPNHPTKQASRKKSSKQPPSTSDTRLFRKRPRLHRYPYTYRIPACSYLTKFHHTNKRTPNPALSHPHTPRFPHSLLPLHARQPPAISKIGKKLATEPPSIPHTTTKVLSLSLHKILDLAPVPHPLQKKKTMKSG